MRENKIRSSSDERLESVKRRGGPTRGDLFAAAKSQPARKFPQGGAKSHKYIASLLCAIPNRLRDVDWLVWIMTANVLVAS
jgi:hypothetical protein